MQLASAAAEAPRVLDARGHFLFERHDARTSGGDSLGGEAPGFDGAANDGRGFFGDARIVTQIIAQAEHVDPRFQR